MIRNEVESRIKLPNPTITDVRDEENWIYVNSDEEGEDTDAEIERQTRLSPPRPHAPPPHVSGAPPTHVSHTHTHTLTHPLPSHEILIFLQVLLLPRARWYMSLTL